MHAPSPPPPPPRENPPLKNEGPAVVEEKTQEPSASVAASPLKAAADLIQTLDLAYAEMTHCAADAARDAEQARRNARTASEIARRYIHRSYPKVHTTAFGSPVADNTDRPPRPLERGLQESKEVTVDDHYTSDPLHELNGNAASSSNSRPPTPNRLDPKSRQHVSSSSPSRNRARIYHTPSSADRIAQSHAEDVLGLSMELERSKNAFKSEQRMHDETKVALSNQKMKTSSLEEENKRLREQLQNIDRERDEKIWNLEHELAKAKLYVEAAEEDAQLALDLAKESSEKRDETDQELQRALEELQTLKEQPPPQLETPRRLVRFADQSSSRTGVVAAGPHTTDAEEKLLRRPCTDFPEEEDAPMQFKQDASPLAFFSSTSQQQSPSRQLSESEDCQNAANLIQESGRRLELPGHWWRKGHENPTITQEMEVMTRQYCQSVEFKVDRQTKEIKELESLCGFLEKKLVSGSEGP